MSALLLAITGAVNIKVTYDWEYHDEDVAPWKLLWHHIFILMNLLLLSIVLTTATVFLVYNVRKYFKERLKAEACRVMTINVFFTVANLTRGIAFIVTHCLPSQEEAYKNYTGRLIYCIGLNFWDVMPLSLIMTYHYQNFLTESSEESVSETTTEESSSPSASS